MMEEKLLFENPQYPNTMELNLEELYADWYASLDFSPDYFGE